MIPEQLKQLPILIVYPVSRCNCRCVMCDYWQTGKPSQLSLDQIRDLIPDCLKLGVKMVVISGGEPLLHPELPEICHVFQENSIAITLLTNGLLLADKAPDLVDQIQELIVSIDGPEPIHDAIRGVPGGFEKLVGGIETARRYRPDLPVTARFTVQRLNFRYLRETVRTAHTIGLNSISFLAVDATTDAFARKNIDRSISVKGLLLSPPEIDELDREIDAMVQEFPQDYDSGFIVESPDKLRKKLTGYFKGAAGLNPFPEITCNAPLVSAVVESDGAVRSCFFSGIVGNIRESGLLQVLESENAMTARRDFQQNRFQSCHRCVCSLNLK